MVFFTANPILSKYVRLCPRFSPFFPGFPENRADFLTFLRQSFFMLPVTGSPNPAYSIVISTQFFLAGCNCREIFVTLYKHRGAEHPPQALK